MDISKLQKEATYIDFGAHDGQNWLSEEYIYKCKVLGVSVIVY